jgi:predicted secreted protein
MAKQLGRALLVKIGDGEASEAFANLCGLNSKSLTINNSAIDVTTPGRACSVAARSRAAKRCATSLLLAWLAAA